MGVRDWIQGKGLGDEEEYSAPSSHSAPLHPALLVLAVLGRAEPWLGVKYPSTLQVHGPIRKCLHHPRVHKACENEAMAAIKIALRSGNSYSYRNGRSLLNGIDF